MENNERMKRIALFSLLLLCVTTVLGGITYAFFGIGLGEKQNQSVTVKAGTLALTFSDTSDTPTNVEKTMYFGDTVEKELKIENTGTRDAYAKISWENLVNTYLPKSLTYTLQYRESTNQEWTDARTTRKNVPTSATPTTQELANGLLVPAGKTYIYKLVIRLENLKTIDQTQDLQATFVTKFTLEEGKEQKYTEMVAYNSTEKIWSQKENIKKIVFEDEMNPKSNATYTYDMSVAGDNGIMAYLVPTEENSTKYIAYIQADGKISANANMSSFFSGFSVLESIENISILDTSNVTNMVSMFYECSSLTSLDLSNFDTSNVTSMKWLFSNCKKLTSIDVSNFDTSKVSDTAAMFYSCNSLTSLDLSNFDTSNVTDMTNMFGYCSELSTLDLSGFNTSNTLYMGSMFYYCIKLSSIDLSSFDTSKTIKMAAMFFYCSSLSILDVSNFNTSEVTDMNSMFENCSSLTTMDLSNFDTSKVTDMNSMFNNCSSLTTMDLSNFDTSKVIKMNYMFYNCSSLITLNLKNFQISSFAQKEGIFNNVPSTITIMVSDDSTKNWVINASSLPKLTDSNILIA